jgi:ribosomal protein S6
MKKQTYELSYWLKENADESNNFIKKIFNDFNCEIIQEIPLKTKKLSYPIKKETIGKFGTFYFYCDNEKIEDLKKQINKDSNILRFIILQRNYLKLNSSNNK